MAYFKTQKTLVLSIAVSLSILALGCGAEDPTAPGVDKGNQTSTNPNNWQDPTQTGFNQYNCVQQTNWISGEPYRLCYKTVPLQQMTYYYGIPVIDSGSISASAAPTDMQIDVQAGDRIRISNATLYSCTTSTGEWWIFNTYSSSCSFESLSGLLYAGVNDGDSSDTWAEWVGYSSMASSSGHQISESGRLHVGFDDDSLSAVQLNYYGFWIYHCRNGSDQPITCPNGASPY